MLLTKGRFCPHPKSAFCEEKKTMKPIKFSRGEKIIKWLSSCTRSAKMTLIISRNDIAVIW